MTRVGAYLRISDDRDGEQTATSRQREDCERFADGRGWHVQDVFEDVDLSAYKRKVKRPEFERMIAAVRAKEIDGVVCWHIDRLTRHRSAFARLMDACEDTGAFIATVTDGVDTRTNAGQFIADVLVGHARMSSADATRRLERWHQQRVEQGKPGVGGNRRFGYSRQYEIIETEAALVREAVSRLFAGESMRGIARDWHRRGVVTPRGNAWHPSALRRMLMAPHLSAQRERDGVLTPGAWTPIITPAETTRIRAIMSDPARTHGKPAPRSYLLTGIARCGHCGEGLTGAPNGHHRRYGCLKRLDRPNCGRIHRMADPVDELVTEMVFEALRNVNMSAFVESTGAADVDGLAEAIRDDEAGLEELSSDFYVKRVIGRSEFFTARASLTARIETNRARLAATSRGSFLATLDAGEAVERQWAGQTLEWQRAVISSLVESVTINPPKQHGARIFDPEAIVVKWKF